MSAYVISMMTVHDPETYKKYTDVTPPTVKRHGGKFLTRGDQVTTAEGETFTERLVILEFPDRKHAEDWLKDPDYEAAAKFRRAASTSRLIIQEGRGNTEDPDPMV
jgi:uncharacterized protein (DUF1330 family)